MEPQENRQITVRKAISAHEQADAALGDLAQNFPGAGWARMIERMQQNLAELRAEAEASTQS